MNWHTLSLSEIEQNLSTQIGSGLTRARAEELLRTHGPNKIPEAKVDSLLVLFLRQFKSPLIFILLAASGAVFYLGEIIDGAIILFVLIFNAIVGTIQEGKAQNTLSALKKFTQTNATVLRDGKEIIIPDAEVVPGDVLILQEGEKVPADARVIESRDLTLDEAALTGESHPIHKITELLEQPNLPVADQKNMIFKGTYITAGNGRAITATTGTNTVIGKISEKITLIESEIPLKANVRYLSRLIVIVVAAIISLLFIGGIIAGQSAIEMFKVAVSLAVSIIPEGLPIVMTIVLVSGVSRMARRNALVKKLQAVEALGQTRVIAVDKTGTITKNEMIVKELFAGRKTFKIFGSGYNPKGEIVYGENAIDPISHPELITAGKIAAFCSNAHLSVLEETGSYKVTGDPMEAALLVFAQKIGFHKHELENEFPKLNEIPFDYQKKYHAVSHKSGGRQFVSVIGAPEMILSLSKKILKDGKEGPFEEKDRNETEERFLALSRAGMRVIALAMAELPLEKELKTHDHLPPLVFVGLCGIEDAPREEAKDAIAQAQGAGVRVVMITGDHKETAVAVARAVGIFRDGDTILTGAEIDALSDAELALQLDSTSVFARVTPEHKLKIIQAYKQRGEIIAMTGDGINDAPPLVAADLGVAMGKIGTEVAKEASDIVLLDDNFASIVAAIEEGRNIYKTIKKVILYLFSTSLGEVLIIGGTLVLGYPLPVLAAQIIWLNLVTDGFLDVALAMEPKEAGLLDKNFERPKKYLMDKLMIVRMAVMGITMMVGSLWVFSGYFEQDLPKAMTITLTTLAIFQWFNAWNCRSEDKSIFKMSPFSNKYLIMATLIIISLQIMAVYAPFMQKILKTVPLLWHEWALAAAVAFFIVIAEEWRKFAYSIYKVKSS